MKPLLSTVALICLVISAAAIPENIEDVKELPQTHEPVVEAEESEPQARAERCTTCIGGGLPFSSPNRLLAQIQAIPGAEIHTQSSFEGCSSEKGCAGIKVKDGSVVEKFGNIDAFRAAAASDSGNEFTFHAAGNGNVFEGGIPNDGPFWWMNQNSPFKNTAGGGNFEKFSKSSSSFSSSGNAAGAGAGAGGAAFGASLDLAGNPFLNGEFSKTAGGFNAQGGEIKPSSFQSSSFESSSYSSSNKGEIDLSKNPFLNGGFKQGAGFQAQGAYSGQGSQFGQGFAGSSQGGQIGQGQIGQGQIGQAGSAGQFASGSKFSSSGYTGSSPSPFTASTAGSNVNLIQNSQKSEFDFEQQSQQTQQNIDEAFQGTGNVQGNVHAHEHSGGELQQTCAGQGYVCVHKAQCNNGVVNTNGAGILQAKTKKQYCNTRTEICCRIEISTLTGAGGLQGSLGVGSATYSGSGSQGSGLFVSSNQGSQSQGSQGSQNSGASNQGFGANGQSGFKSSSSSFESSSTYGNRGTQGSGTENGFGVTGSFGSGSQGSGFNSNSNNAFGAGGSINRGLAVESSSSSFESRGSSGSSGSNGGIGSIGGIGVGTVGLNSGSGFNTNKFGASGTYSGSNSGSNFGSTVAPNRFGSTTGNEVVYKQTSQSNFIENDSFSAGSDNTALYRPGSGSINPGVPYLPPGDSSSSGSSSGSSFLTTFSTPRPFSTAKPTYLPPVTSTAAPTYLPPQVPAQTINTETRVPNPNYNEGQLILDETRQPRPKPTPPPKPADISSACAAALKCTPIEFCTAEGVISNTTVVLTREQDAYRVPLTDCRDLESGRIGKCCRDPFYTDPWPTNQLGKWVPGVFGGNDGKYSPDNRGSGSSARAQVTGRPPVTGSTLLNNFRTVKPTIPPFGPNQVTPGYPPSTVSQGSYGQKGQLDVRFQGQFGQGGQGQFGQGGQGQFGVAGQGSQGSSQFAQGSQFTSTTQSFGSGSTQLDASRGQGQGQIVSQGQGQYTQQGQGQYAQGGRGQYAVGGVGQLEIQGQGAQGQFSQTSQTSQTQKGFGQTVIQGQGQSITQGQGQGVIRGQGQSITTGQGQSVSQGQGVTRGQGQAVITGQGQTVSQGFGSGSRQGSGFSVSQGGGFGVENEYSESVQRVFLQQYNGGGQCGLFNGQKPYGNRNDLEVDFAEIPWQAMVLLQTNRSLLCGGVITRPDVVITSAACVEGLNAKNVLIKGGEWKLGIDDEPLPFQIVQVKTILRHPFYKRGSLHYDVAILVLAENLRFEKNIYPICVPRAGETLDAFYNGAGECIVTGWGKQVLQAHLAGSIMHSVNVSLINPGECQAKLSQEYPHLLEQYDQESCACGQPTNPINNICRVDIGSALACTTDNSHYVLRGIYSWDSGCQLGNQLAAFFKFDVEWYEWAIGLIESARFAQFSSGSQILSQNRFAAQINSGIKGSQVSGAQSSGGQISGGQISGGQISGGQFSGAQISGGQIGGLSSVKGVKGFGVTGKGQYGAQGFSQFSSSSSSSSSEGGYGTQIKAPITNSFSASYSEKKVFQSEPKFVTYTTKPEIVTFTTKPEYFTYTTKPKIVTYTTKPQIIRYETSGSVSSPQYAAPSSYNPSYSDVIGQHSHSASCKCLGKK